MTDAKMAMKLGKDVKLVLYGIVVTAYMALSYQIVKDLMTAPVDTSDIIKTAYAGLISLGY